MKTKQLIFVTFLAAAVFFAIYFLIYAQQSDVDNVQILNQQFGPLNEEVVRLERLLDFEREKLKRVQAEVDSYIRANRIHHQNAVNIPRGSDGGWPEAIGVLVFVCNRAEAIKSHLDKLIAYRKNVELFPIIVSQDCDNEEVANVVKSFGSQVNYIKHLSGDKADIVIPPNHKHYTSYYRISRHYRLGLDHIFHDLKLGSVIITEDDLDVSPDFFEYFSATRWLLEADKKLFCVSAWNDNGKAALIDMNAQDLLYRSDFFPGLGWMMTKDLWAELGHLWPTGFWDDWIRDPARRKGRECIRPEVSRTAMTNFGKKGASKGLFFDGYLKKIVLNEKPVNFSHMQLSYLLKENYDEPFIDRIYGLQKMSIEQVISTSLQTNNTGLNVRIEYASMHEYTQIARKLHIMIDTKAGVPRTAYRGVVTCFINGLRVYVAPADPDSWQGYDSHWEPPQYPLEETV